tara:strand:+ start:2511 stop:3269 length:759 start_codon:yes stop_codon:yes gene_type:complete
MTNLFSKEKPFIKLKHLGVIGADNVDWAQAMLDIVGYRNNWFSKKYRFVKHFKTVFAMIQDIRKTDVSTVEWTEDCPIVKPANIDFISFQAMMELQALLDGGLEEENLSDNISKTIAIACFSACMDMDYDSNSEEFKQFQIYVLEQPIVEMFGLYNWITDSITESAKMWSERFLSVEVLDADYEQANGSRMAQFSVILSVKAMCKEFNIPFKDAWQLSYNLVQTNSYANATSGKIQDDMRILKEAKMKQSRQ